eukprot:COSAG04_NODE_1860_length_5374_cov_3.470142_4_plen_115_part_00
MQCHPHTLDARSPAGARILPQRCCCTGAEVMEAGSPQTGSREDKSTPNPIVGADDDGMPTLADLETALEGLRAETVTPEEVVRVMDDLYQRRSTLTAVVRTVFSHLTIAPTNVS